MPQLRKDPIANRWVIISPERAKRPQPRRVEREPAQAGPCPFCTGNEAMTPPELLAFRGASQANMSGWTLRVVPNKFPAVISEGSADLHAEGIYHSLDGLGAHEIIIETPQHEVSMASLSEARRQQ